MKTNIEIKQTAYDNQYELASREFNGGQENVRGEEKIKKFASNV